MIRNRERSGFIHGARIVNGAPDVSHLFFADDCFLFFRANTEEARIIQSILVIYGAACGQKVDFNKSLISFSENTRADSIASVCNILEVKATANHGMYLGLPSAVGGNKFKAFRFIKDRVWRKLERWNEWLLSRVGKEILLKTVAQALPNYTMNLFLLPLDLCRQIEVLLNSFWWGRKNNSNRGINWMCWDRLCRPKAANGLGFKKLQFFNLAMLGRQCWRRLTRPDSLVARILKAKYHRNTNFSQASIGKNSSYSWCFIMAAHDLVVKGSRIRIGNETCTLIKNYPWLPDLSN